MDEIFEFTLVMGTEQVYLSMNRDWSQCRYSWDSKNHNHPGLELHVILKGSCLVDVEGKTYPVTQGQSILIGTGRYHRPISVSKDLERFSVSFFPEPGVLRAELTRASADCRICDIPAEMLDTCSSIFRECGQERLFRNTILRSLMTLLLGQEFRLLQIVGDSGGSTDAANYSKYTDAIDAFFEYSPPETARVEDLADRLHLSRSQVNRVLKKLYGMTFREKLIRTRMDHASWLLCHTEKPVSEVAAAVGYQSESRFYQRFRNCFGTTPEQYRRAHADET